MERARLIQWLIKRIEGKVQEHAAKARREAEETEEELAGRAAGGK
jgi:hypothetical protein